MVASLIHAPRAIFTSMKNFSIPRGCEYVFVWISLWAFAGRLPAAAAELDEPIKPIPLSVPMNSAKVELGKTLFGDRRLSKDNAVSCASCHVFDKGGAFPAVKPPVGAGGKMHVLNSPSAFNVV